MRIMIKVFAGFKHSTVSSLRSCSVTSCAQDTLAKEMTHDLEMNFNKIAPSSRGLYSTLLIHAILVAISLLGGQCKSARFFPESTLLGRRRVARGRSVEKERRISFDDVSKSQLALLPRFGKEDTAKELQDHAADTQDTLVDAVENAEVAEIKRAVFRALTRLRAATIKEFDTIARLETQAIDASEIAFSDSIYF